MLCLLVLQLLVGCLEKRFDGFEFLDDRGLLGGLFDSGLRVGLLPEEDVRDQLCADLKNLVVL